VIALKSKALFLLFILLLSPLLSACTARELNTISLVTALGIDKDDAGYAVTYQVLNPKPIAAKKSVDEAPFVLYSEKGKSLDEINKRVTTQAARKIYAAHVRAVVVGEDVARDGLKDILDYLFRSVEYRTDYYFIIAKGTTARQILSTVTAIDSISGMKLFESIENSKKWWAPTSSLQLVELVNDINAKGKNPVLAGVEFYEETKDEDTIGNLKTTSPGKIKFTALGAFHHDKLIGWFDESESIGFSNIVGKAKSSSAFVDFDDNTRVSLYVNEKKTKIKASLSDGKPVINVMFSAKMMITAQTGDVDFTDQENLEKLNRLANEKLIIFCKKTLDKAQHELKTDVFGFGESIHRAYPKVWGELKNNWDDEFTTLQVNFTADMQVMDLGQNLKPIIREEE
jgi:spore germination protein KC